MNRPHRRKKPPYRFNQSPLLLSRKMNQETEAKTPSVPRLSKQRSRAPNTSSTRPAQVATFRYLQRGKHPSIRTCESSPNDEWKHRRSITGSRRLLIYTAVPTAGDAGPRLPVPMPMPMPSQNVKQGVRTAAASDIRRLPPVPQCQTRPLACCGIDVDTGTARHYLQRILSENTVSTLYGRCVGPCAHKHGLARLSS